MCDCDGCNSVEFEQEHTHDVECSCGFVGTVTGTAYGSYVDSGRGRYSGSALCEFHWVCPDCGDEKTEDEIEISWGRED